MRHLGRADVHFSNRLPHDNAAGGMAERKARWRIERSKPSFTALSNFCRVMGFSKKEWAPIFVASTAVSMVAWPLIMITGMAS